MNAPTVAIIGSGFSGLGSAIHLKNKLNIKADIFESTKDVGGTWNYSTYPGCACDVPSHLYSFSFELNPNWSEKFSSQKEIHEYIVRVARKYDLYNQVIFSTKVVRASWLEESKKWELELKSEGIAETRLAYYDIVFSGVGTLRIPNIPQEFLSFEGKIIHSANWDNDYDLTNKKVAVIGNGASSVQIIPAIHKKVAHLYSYQRTPNWILPRDQSRFPTAVKFLFRWVPLIMHAYRMYLFFMFELYFKIISDSDSLMARLFKGYLKRHTERVLISKGRPDLIEKLVPSFKPGCKRVGVSESYLETLCERNVTVISSPIKEIVGRRIITEDGEETEVDVLCLATGFNTGDFFGDLKVYGRGGVHLNELWSENSAATYKTVNIHGFPNFFMLLGPGSGLGHNSVVIMMEIQVDYAIRLIENMKKNKIKCIDPKLEPQVKFTTNLQAGFKGSALISGCKSWYLDKYGHVRFLWSKDVSRFYFTLRNIDMDDFIQDK